MDNAESKFTCTYNVQACSGLGSLSPMLQVNPLIRPPSPGSVSNLSMRRRSGYATTSGVQDSQRQSMQ